VNVTVCPTVDGLGDEVSVVVVLTLFTVVVAVALSLPGFGSMVEEDTVAVLVMVPAAFTATTSVKVAPPTAIEDLVQETRPPEPTGGVEQLQPPEGDSETNVVVVGNVSDRTTDEAAFGPALFTEIV